MTAGAVLKEDGGCVHVRVCVRGKCAAGSAARVSPPRDPPSAELIAFLAVVLAYTAPAALLQADMGVAAISRLLKIIGLFCRISSLL